MLLNSPTLLTIFSGNSKTLLCRGNANVRLTLACLLSSIFSTIKIKQYKSNIEKIAKIVTDNDCNLAILGITIIESDEKFLWKPNKYYDNDIISELKELCKNNKIMKI